jgi:geranylgeranylglycerol-phosphate geranylgeranyltransferase
MASIGSDDPLRPLQATADVVVLRGHATRSLRRHADWVKLAAYARLPRPGDNLFAFLGTVLGAGLAGVSQPVWAIVSVAASNALLSAGSMMINDWHDVGEDAVNRPDRPVPSGQVPREHALALGLAALGAGCAVAALAGWPFGAAAVLVTALSVLYTTTFKATPVVGNLVTGLLSAYPLWCWYALDDVSGRVYVGAIAAFLLGGVGREIVRTAADEKGDASLGIRTVATVWGGHVAIRCGAAVIVAAALLGWISAFGSSWPWYRAALAVTVAVVAGAGAHALIVDSPITASRRLTLASRSLTFVLALAVVVDLFAGGWGPR